jgi:hypothetical protein
LLLARHVIRNSLRPTRAAFQLQFHFIPGSSYLIQLFAEIPALIHPAGS